MSTTGVLGYPSNPGFSLSLPPRFQFSYASSQPSSASSSSISSFFSTDANSFQSFASSVSSASGDLSLESGCGAESKTLGTGEVTIQNSQNPSRRRSKRVEAPLPAEWRQNPRRTSGVACAQRPPTLVRQCERKDSFVDGLVDSASQIVETIWPLSVLCMKNDAAGSKAVFPLRIFIQETLRRSRTSYSTLQVALYYLVLIKKCVSNVNSTSEERLVHSLYPRAVHCGRRMFLAALILASKYLQDRNYSARAWSKISGLSTAEINQNEWAFLEAVDWKLHVPEPLFQRWSDIVWKCTPKPGDFIHGEGLRWSNIIPRLNPELDIDLGGQGQLSPDNGSFANALEGSEAASGTVSLPMRPSRQGAAKDQPPAFLRDILSASAPEQSSMGQCKPTLPPLPALGLLPTPQMTPQLSNVYTPAASVDGSCHPRPSIGGAMSQAQSMSVQRSAIDRCPSMARHSQPTPSRGIRRRSSLARSSSSSSSPESMISDVFSHGSSRSSRSSRSSSISSVASGNCAPAVHPRISRQGSRQGARSQSGCLKASKKTLSIASPINEVDFMDTFCLSPDTYSTGSASGGELPSWSSESSAHFSNTHEAAAHVLCELSGSQQKIRPPLARTVSSSSMMSTSSETSQQSRKRSRTDSIDTNLQWTVRRDLLKSIFLGQSRCDSTDSVLPDGRVPDSFLTPNPAPSLPVHNHCQLSMTADEAHEMSLTGLLDLAQHEPWE